MINGQLSSSEKKQFFYNVEKANKGFVIISTGKYIGEGFDEKKLQEFLETFEKAAVDLNNGLVTWPDICKNIERLTNIRVSLIDDLQKVGGLFDDE